MVLPAVSAVILPLALAFPAFRSHFNAPLSPRLLAAFLLSAAIMAVHKLESFWFGEFDQCPVYRDSGNAPWAQNPRKALFIGFVPTFIGMLLVASLALIGPPWHLVIMTIWLAQGVHELHHSAKSLARGRLYPGAVSSVLFVAVVALGIFPAWHDSVIGPRGAVFVGYYLLLPCVFLAFYLEDRRWIAEADPAIWDPA
jgi:hypothetical protein